MPTPGSRAQYQKIPESVKFSESQENFKQSVSKSPYRSYLHLIWVALLYYLAKNYVSHQAVIRLNNFHHEPDQITKVSSTYETNSAANSTRLTTSPNQLEFSYPHEFKFDGRPKSILYEFTKEEVKLCTCGKFNCQEQESIETLFKHKQRPSFEQYLKAFLQL